MKAQHTIARLLAGSTALSCLFAAPLLAQNLVQDLAQDDTVALGTITLEVAGAGAVGDVGNPFTLSGMKTATEITDVPQSVTVVGRETFGKQQVRKVDQALLDVAGVQSQLYGYDSDTNWFYIRGFASSDTGAFMDGLSLFSYGFGTFYIDPFLLERIEVLKGPASMLYGASSPGGLVNYVSRLPDGSEGTTLSFSANSESQARASVEGSGTNGDDLAWRYGIQATRQDGYGMFDAGFEGVAYGAVTKSFDDGSKLTFHLSYTDMDEDHVGGSFLPYYGTAAPGPFGYFDEYYNGGNPDADTYKRKQLIATGIYRRDIGEWQMVDTFRVGYTDLKELYLYPNGFTSGQIPTPSADVNRFVFAHDSYATILQNDLRFTRDFDTGSVRHKVLFGLDARQYRLDQQQAFAVGTPLDPVNPVYSVAQPTALFTYIDNVSTQRQLGLYAQDQIEWGDGWIATLNGRFDVVWSEMDNNLGADLKRRDDAFTWRVALAKRIGDVTPYVTVGTYFNPQSLSEYSLRAEPETGHQAEVGVKWALSENSLITVSAFDITRKDVSQNYVNGGNFDSNTLGKVRSKGIEVEANVALNEELRLRMAATRMDVTIEKFTGNSAFDGKTPQSVAERFGNLQLAWSPAAVEGLELRAGTRYLGSSWADNANTLKVGDAWLYDIGASWNFAETWTADLNVTNLTNERYTASCQTSFGVSACWQGEGRVVTLGVSTRF
ncbi:TonB-dependent siderophore receptor [Xinfangfangia sp. D13-10-4-6]|uniref:TonB-dependent siderophore receptor n=1 Tax=Pseudogemmobacter hezensis TaxID=2737662 RepID=UPI001556E5BE|nr:TonB-dependent siderophore receptor [Pseudogemmobacter hezensis]NPD15527.1 TonB-dependent siderophore receptor [Pseudogemmobacter hezensis]